MKKNIALLFASIAFTLLLTFLVDRGLGLFIDRGYDLVFTRYSEVVYSTSEFHSVARVNNLGYRGQDRRIDSDKRYRILALGDSHTFGWGVGLEHTWPSLLNQTFQDNHVDAEVINLGRPGAGPRDYAEIAKEAIPLLKPDLVVITVSQGDDVNQLMREEERLLREQARSSTSAPKVNLVKATKELLKAVYPHFVELKHRMMPPPTAMVTEKWKTQAADMIAQLEGAQKARYEQLDEVMHELYLSGNLNPVYLVAIVDSQWALASQELGSSEVQAALKRMAVHFGTIKQQAEGVGSEVVVISTPGAHFVAQANYDSFERMGFNMNPDILTTTVMDESIQQAAGQAGLAFFEVTQAFREKAKTETLFFEYDAHKNEAGQQLFAEQIEPIIRQQLLTLN